MPAAKIAMEQRSVRPKQSVNACFVIPACGSANLPSAGILGMPTGPFLYADQLMDTLHKKAEKRCASPQFPTYQLHPAQQFHARKKNNFAVVFA